MKRILKYSLLLLVGCSTPYQLPSQYQLAPKTTETVKNPHFSVGEQYLYRATITAYGHTFSGLLAAKITADNAWRVALTTDFGNTLFQFYYRRGEGWRVEYITEALDRKPLIRLLERDFEDLLQADRYADKYTHNQEVAYVATEGKRKVYLFENQDKKIYKQENIKGSKHYTTFAAHYKAGGELSQIVIEHHTVPVKITLDVL